MNVNSTQRLQELDVSELRNMLSSRGLNESGNKMDMINRLLGSNKSVMNEKKSESSEATVIATSLKRCIVNTKEEKRIADETNSNSTNSMEQAEIQKDESLDLRGITISEGDLGKEDDDERNEDMYLEVEEDFLELDDDIGYGNNLDVEKSSTQPELKEVADTPQDPNPKALSPSRDDRCLWISNLAPETRTADLKTMCGNYGKVESAKVVTSASRTSVKKFYGFIVMQNSSEAQACVDKLNNTEIHGKVISIEKRHDQPGTESSSSSKDDIRHSSKSSSHHTTLKHRKESEHRSNVSSTRRSPPRVEDARKKIEEKEKRRSLDRRVERERRGDSRSRISTRASPRSSHRSHHGSRTSSERRSPKSLRVSTDVGYHRLVRARSPREDVRELRLVLEKKAAETHRESERVLREREEQQLLREREQRKLEEERHMLVKERLEREKVIKQRLELEREILAIERERKLAEQKLLQETEELKRLASIQRSTVNVTSSSSKVDDRRRRHLDEKSPERPRRDAKYSKVDVHREQVSHRYGTDTRRRESSPTRRPTSPRRGSSARHAPSPRRGVSPRRPSPRRVISPKRASSPRRGVSPKRSSRRDVSPKRVSPERRIIEDRNRNGHESAYHSRKPLPIAQKVVREVPRPGASILGDREVDVSFNAASVYQGVPREFPPQLEEFKRTVQVQDANRHPRAIIPPDHPRAMQSVNSFPVSQSAVGMMPDPRQFYVTNTVPDYNHSTPSSFSDIAYGSSHRSNRNVGMR